VASRSADLPSKEVLSAVCKLHSFRLILEENRPEGLKVVAIIIMMIIIIIIIIIIIMRRRKISKQVDRLKHVT
jgi:hypothetical protein